MAFVMRTSVHGRRLGISSTGGLISASKSTGGNSTAFEMAAQMWGPVMFQTVATAGTIISNIGISVVSSDSTAGSTMTMAAPAKGAYKEVHFQTTATAIGIDTSATTIYINSTLAETAAGGSTSITVTGPATGVAGVMVLRGLSTTAWGVVGHTVAYSS